MDAALRGVCFVQGALQIYIMSLARSELSIKMQQKRSHVQWAKQRETTDFLLISSFLRYGCKKKMLLEFVGVTDANPGKVPGWAEPSRMQHVLND